MSNTARLNVRESGVKLDKPVESIRCDGGSAIVERRNSEGSEVLATLAAGETYSASGEAGLFVLKGETSPRVFVTYAEY